MYSMAGSTPMVCLADTCSRRDTYDLLLLQPAGAMLGLTQCVVHVLSASASDYDSDRLVSDVHYAYATIAK